MNCPEPQRTCNNKCNMLYKWNGINMFTFLLVLALVALQFASAAIPEEPEGPRITSEPLSCVDFANTTGTRLDCTATGHPRPEVTWVREDGTAVSDVAGLRRVFTNGTLELLPFRAEEYRQDVHTTTYRCLARNSVGTVIGRRVLVRGVVKQFYKVQVYDEFVINGNLAVLHCNVPSFVKEYVAVSGWHVDDKLVETTGNYGRYRLLQTGQLYISDVNVRDGQMSYRCKVRHILTGDVVFSTSGRLIVTDPKNSVSPRVLHTLATLKARGGSTVEIPCAVQGYPPPQTRWFKIEDKGPVAVDDARRTPLGGLLLINDVGPNDSGRYICVVSNSQGEERIETHLTVTDVITVRIQPRVQAIDVGKPATFICVISGFPLSNVDWRKNGMPLTALALGRIKLPSREILQILSVERDDRGMYQCLVENDDDNAQAAAELKLGDAAPVFVRVFAETNQQPGFAIFLECLASGNPPPVIEWALDGEPISKGRRVTVGQSIGEWMDSDVVIGQVNITKAKVDDGGEYSCVAINRVGKVQHSARLNIYGVPYIRPLSNVSVVAGKDFSVSCRVSGHPIRSISWETGTGPGAGTAPGMPLPVHLRQKVYPNGTLYVRESERTSDQGWYTCVAQNDHGQQTRSSVWVSVIEPPMIEPFAFPKILSETMRARVLCTVIRGDLPLTITWTKDGKPLDPEHNVAVESADDFSSSLTFRSVAARHRGNYTCAAGNAAATVNHTAALLVHVAPRWSVEPKDANVLEGSRVVIDCMADGFPSPSIAWMRGGGPRNGQNEAGTGEYHPLDIRGYRYHTEINGSLRIDHVRKEDESYFLCQASNGIGSGLSKVVYLKVNVAAYFPIKHNTHSAIRWKEAILVCEARGDLPIQLTWRRNGEMLHLAGEHRIRIREKMVTDGLVSELLVDHVEREDGVPYNCHSRNAFGEDQAVIDLVVQEPPAPPTDLKATHQGSRYVHLSWSLPFDGNSPVTKYMIQRKEHEGEWDKEAASVGGSDTAGSIMDLVPGSTYHFRVIAVNEVGDSLPSDSIRITLNEEAPGGPPTSVQVKPTGSRSLLVTWKPPKRDHWHGSLTGYYVGYRLYESSEPYQFRSVEVSDQATLKDLNKYSKYGVVVQAFNSMGSGPYSDEIVAHTFEDVPDKPPMNVQCTALSSQSVSVTWEPPIPSSHNGVVHGYKVLYVSLAEVPVAQYLRPLEVTVTGLRAGLDGLEKFRNYSVQVLAFTRAGDGVASDPIHCRTLQDVPAAPADIKALALSSDGVLITWKPPSRKNGVLVRYTVYMRPVGEQHVKKHVVPAEGELAYEARGLRDNRVHEFWVTATTEVGEGESTKVVAQAPKSSVAARIASFSDQIFTPWRRDIKLPCRSVGIPAPRRHWKFQKISLESSARYEIQTNGVLLINDIRRDDSGNYTCHVDNIYGKDVISYHVVVFAPPEAPKIVVSEVTHSSLTLQLTPGNDGGSKVAGYSLSYKREFGEWEEVQLPGNIDSHTLQNLTCGSKYQLYATASNSVGIGEPGHIVSTSTKGAAPRAPVAESVLKTNSSFATLLLDEWPDEGCPILYLVVQYSPRASSGDWILVSNNAKPSERFLHISGLQPGAYYSLHVVAHNDAGSTVARYDFATLTSDGVMPPPRVLGMEPASGDSDGPFYLDIKWIAPIFASIVAFVGAAAAVFCLIMWRKKQQNRSIDSFEVDHRVGRVKTASEKCPLHPHHAVSTTTPSRDKSRGFHQQQPQQQQQQPTNCRNYPGSLEQLNAYRDDICPYATAVTFPEQRNNPKDVQLHEFRCPITDQNEENLNLDPKMDTYFRARRSTPSPLMAYTDRTTLPHRRSKDKDVLCREAPDGGEEHAGKTPEAVYRLPMSRRRSIEYDSVLSDSDTTDAGLGYCTESVGHLHDRCRVPDLIYHATDSSTSNEASPDEDARPRMLLKRRNYGVARFPSSEHWYIQSAQLEITENAF